MKLVFICSLNGGQTPAQIDKHVFQANIYCRIAFEAGYFPIAPQCYLPNFLDDSDRKERKKAFQLGLKALRKCSELWVFGELKSEEMRAEIECAKEHNIKIRYFDKQGYEL